MADIGLISVKTNEEIEKVSELAEEIWSEHYAPILSPEKIAYMLNKFLSVEAIKKSIEEGYKFYFVEADGEVIGFISIKLNRPRGKMFLSKLYLLKEHRKKGYSRVILDTLEELCEISSLSAIWLTVDRLNPSSEIYKKLGFKTVREAVTDIGGGFCMDDFIMEKEII